MEIAIELILMSRLEALFIAAHQAHVMKQKDLKLALTEET